MTLKKYKNIPVHIVEDHNHVLEYIYKSMGSRHLPLEGNSIIHFDSHPDLMIPKNMPAETVFNKYDLFNSLSIENWLMPACYSGHFNTIKPIWSNQIPTGSYKVLLGKWNNFIRLYSSIYYFISDGLCVPEGKLENKKNLLLNVSHVNATDYVSNEINNKNYVLDIDLDFFSTKNPFNREFEKGKLYEMLEPLFSFTVPNNVKLNVPESEVEEDMNKELICDISEKREKQLDELNKIFQCLEKNDCIDDVENELSDSIILQIKEIIECVKKNYTKIDWWLIHSAGLTWDATELPEHVSTDSELVDMFINFKKFLLELKKPPTLIIIARSTNDDYCPKEQVNYIQKNILEILENVFGTMTIHYHYNNNDKKLDL
ncbi:conserved hypothetical protein [Pediculus humanus corporis]|uniref:Uncharacterized protein n=1 Tax=Pediculus humanus subsp. corporis TaxID=121224 RepID=E0VSQ5_PEDHC|nr:uncharacterized protein Phum_PHUM422170 [Pediculus humanus corporis]EEB16411.1 conserved hypothetical protein [Pediculus humanus corporis]